LGPLKAFIFCRVDSVGFALKWAKRIGGLCHSPIQGVYDTMKSKCKHIDFELAQAAGISVDRFPETAEEAQAATDLLIQSMERLSMEEHESIIWDMHGFDEVVNQEETTSFVNEKLAELQKQLDGIATNEAYNLALQLNPSYVCSRSFRLMFLRCERFNVPAAAEMMVLHFEEKQRLFGNGEILGREVLQSDLGPNERRVLDCGVLQILKKRDAAGRLIFIVVTSKIQEMMYNNDINNDDAVGYFCSNAPCYSFVPLPVAYLIISCSIVSYGTFLWHPLEMKKVKRKDIFG
jgi:hypothetical protein